MSEHDLLRSVELARKHLNALRARMDAEGAAPESSEIRAALGDLLEMFEKLQAHYGLLREILASSSDAVFAKDLHGKYVMINIKGAAMLGKSVEQILGQDDTALFDRKNAERIMAIDSEIMRTGKPRTYEETFDLLGVPTTMLTTKTAWVGPEGKLRGLIGSAQDVTERKLAERKAEERQHRLRSLASEIVITEERLRQSLAADLHNGLGQDIALAKMKLSALRSSSTDDLHDSLTRIERLVEQADRSLRSITYQLSPPSLHDLGLVPALQWLAEDLESRYGLVVRIEHGDTLQEVDSRMRLILFRAVRELLINIVTHAGTHQARVRIDSADYRVRITVQDDGAGFEPVKGSLQGYGLFGIREQLVHVGGSMQIDSVPGGGTTVVLMVPLVAEATATN